MVEQSQPLAEFPAGDEARVHIDRPTRSAFVSPVYTIVLACIFVGALVVGWAVLPGQDERIEALERDGQTARALAMLEARFNRGDHRQRTLATLRRFYEYYGNTEKSQKMLELLAADRPRDLYIQRELAQFYRFNQDTPDQIKALKAQLSIRYSEPVCQRLIGLLHLTNQFDDERAALISCRAAGYRRPEGLERLASLYAAEGKLVETAEILGAVDDRRWLRGSHERLMLFDALMTTGKQREAFRRGIRWYKGQPDADLALEMISRLVSAGHNDFAMQLAREVGTPGDPVALAVGEILVDQVQYDAARTFLAGWLNQAKSMSVETANRFVAAAIDAGDAALALRCAERQGLETFQSGDLVPLAEALYVRGQLVPFDKIRSYLSPETIQADGLIAGAIELREGRTEAARSSVGAVIVDRTDERRAQFKSYLVALAGHSANSTRLVRDAAQTEVQLAPPVIAVSPNETQSKRIVPDAVIAKRFKRYRRKRPITPRPP